MKKWTIFLTNLPRKVIWLNEAKDDLKNIRKEYGRKNKAAAARIIKAIRAKGRLLGKHTQVGPLSHRRKGVRQAVVTRTPFIIYYKLSGKTVNILAVVHHGQDE